MEPCEIIFLINFNKQKLITFVQLVWKLQILSKEFLRAPHFGRIMAWPHLNKETTIFIYNKVLPLQQVQTYVVQDDQDKISTCWVKYWNF
jgi:hypothetical protein